MAKQIIQCHICLLDTNNLIKHAIEGFCELTTERLINIGYCTEKDVVDYITIINKGMVHKVAPFDQSNTK